MKIDRLAMGPPRASKVAEAHLSTPLHIGLLSFYLLHAAAPFLHYRAR
jgi:hypothetical protein